MLESIACWTLFHLLSIAFWAIVLVGLHCMLESIACGTVMQVGLYCMLDSIAY